MDGAGIDRASERAESREAEVRAACSYDQTPYSVGAFPQTHPDLLATVGTIFGMRPAPPEQCRVLELGCASGGNLVPMAAAYPASRFVGIDLSARQIADGQAVVRELGLRNVELVCRSITDVTRDTGEFDYILAHGVYSWVPPEVQEKILDIYAVHLAPQGVAYVSYNCYPGWHARGAIREMLWYHTERLEDPDQRVRAARGLLAFLIRSAPASDGGYGALVRQELALLQATPDTYLLHEHLEEYNEPLYFHQFAGRFGAKGLRYLGEAQVGAMLPGRFGAETDHLLRQISPDLLHMEQYMDFLRNRMFRQTLLCRADVPLDHSLSPDRVTGLYVASPARPVPGAADSPADDAEDFRGPGGKTLSTRDPLMRAAMRHLGEVWPRRVRFDELFQVAIQRVGRPGGDPALLATRLLNCYTSGIVELAASPAPFAPTVSERPVASPYARLRARDGGKIVNLRLETILLGDVSRRLLQWLDGNKDVEALADAVADLFPGDASDRPERRARAAAYLGEVLPALAGHALLVG